MVFVPANFVPAAVQISGITQANPAVVTTSSNHGFYSGNIVRLNIPRANGMYELAGNTYTITVLSSNSFSLQKSLYPSAQNVDSTNYTPFATPAGAKQIPQALCIGSSPILNSMGTYFESRIDDEVLNNATNS